MNEGKRVSGAVQVYSIQARDQIHAIGMRFFQEMGISNFMDDVFCCVDELIKNAVKANYKLLLIMDHMYGMNARMNPGASPQEIRNAILETLSDRNAYDSIAAEIIRRDNISGMVREVLNEEARHLAIKNMLYREKRTHTPEEREILSRLKNLHKIRTGMKERDFKIVLTMEADERTIFISVTNTAPILSNDLARILEKRREHRQCREEGREYEFFVNNIDTSESGFGLGYATIDCHLLNMGINPEDAIDITSNRDTTVRLALPVEALLRNCTP
jgi:hypothetical protein